ncbi:Type 1 glutamine amidotransferase-like domain-containing protein [Mucilaginibacter xinganensis]|uniref:Peptidase E n=1 Tax=Mucilaginibacter xinganensis TaxID=1234841 RepID=A0A223NRN0_9SPHI|nr:peptidase E [Mucilaginibacter xinganensis]ASU32308.1 peptidase E [Mucilaginibacter xinganensis]
MIRRKFIRQSLIAATGAAFSNQIFALAPSPPKTTKKILLTGGAYGPVWMNYLIKLTGKDKPKVCFLPTASGDSQAYINYWMESAKKLSIEPFVQRVFIESASQKVSFEESLLGMDAILVPGGNTLDMMALWKAHGIDKVLKKAWEKGIVLTGSSAGTICWFHEGLSDSRPIALSKVECLGFLKGSISPHYHSSKTRASVYQEMVLKGEMKPGYGLDENAGLYFENEKIAKVLAGDSKSKVYKVTVENGAITEQVMETEIIS